MICPFQADKRNNKNLSLRREHITEGLLYFAAPRFHYIGNFAENAACSRKCKTAPENVQKSQFSQQKNLLNGLKEKVYLK